MKEISMSQAHQDLENMFGLARIGTLNNEGGKPRLVSTEKDGSGREAAAVGQVIGLILLTVVSLIAFIILCALRNNLKNKFIELQTEILQVNNKVTSDDKLQRNTAFIHTESPALMPENSKSNTSDPDEKRLPVYGGEPINSYNLHKLSKGDVVCVLLGSAHYDGNGHPQNDERMEFLLLEKVIHQEATDTTAIKFSVKDKNEKVQEKYISRFYFLTKEDKLKLDNFKEEDSGLLSN